MIPGTTAPAEIPAGVFISYRRSDSAVAERLYEFLKERHVAAWYDALIPHGVDWRDAIVEHLTSARIMVVLLSSEALESDELKKELAVADQEGVPLLAVRLEEIKLKGAFAYELARSQWFDLFDDPSERLVALADLLAEVAKTPREADLVPLLQRWQRKWPRRVFRRLDRWTRNNRLLVPLFLFVSMAVFVFYNSTHNALKNWEGVGPLVAFSILTLLATVGSPVLFFWRLLTGPDVRDLPFLFAAAVNTVLLALLARNLLSWWAHRQILRRRTSL